MISIALKPSQKKTFYNKSGSIEPLVVTIKYINKQLTVSLKEGDEIVYQPNSEYEFVIDDEVLYRMFTDNITIKLMETKEIKLEIIKAGEKVRQLIKVAKEEIIKPDPKMSWRLID